MFILKIIKNGLTEQSDFATNQEAVDHLAIYKGTDEQIIHHPEQIIHHDDLYNMSEVDGVVSQGELIRPAYDEVIPAWDETIPANYTYSITEESAAIAPISPRQLETALLSLGITYEMVLAQIATLPSELKPIAEIAWRRSGSFVRSEPAVGMIGSLLSLNSVQLDHIWEIGAGL